MNQGVTISDEDKTTHFVGCTEDSGLFKKEWVTEWEATADRSWTVVRDIWVGKWLGITRAVTMAAKSRGYESAAKMQVTARQEWVQRPCTVTRAGYNAVSEYA